MRAKEASTLDPIGPPQKRLKLSEAQLRATFPEGKVRLPCASKAWIPTSPGSNRLKDYALKADHPDGGPKAVLFRERLGIVQDDREYLHDQILKTVGLGWVRAWTIQDVPEDDPLRCLGLRIEAHQDVEGRDGLACKVLTGWRLDTRMAPFLTTTRPLPRGD